MILIDEPSIGLSPLIVLDVFKLLHKRADELLSDPHLERLFLSGAHAAPKVA